MDRDDMGHFFLDGEQPRFRLMEIDASLPGIAEWNAVLLDLLLPLQATPGLPVLLCCDDEVLRKAAGRLGIDPERAASDFTGTLRVAYSIGRASGLKRAAAEGGRFDKLPKPRLVPGFLSLLCLCVLAATHMEGDRTNTASAYYPRLRELLSFSIEGGAPYQFECVPTLFRRLGEWLEKDLLGSRGRLASLETSALPYVGPCVSQTVFRKADVNVLASFFDQRLARVNLREIDSLLMLRHWGEKHRLTKHALALVENRELADLVKSVLETAYRNWDGTVPSPGGGGARGCRATLVIRPSPPFRLGLRLSVDYLLTLHIGGHQILGEPGATAWVPEAGLRRALEMFVDGSSVAAKTRSGGSLTVRVSSNRPGAFFFAKTPEGFRQIGPAAQEGELLVLTCSQELTRSLDMAADRYACDLPENWVLFHSVSPELLGLDLRVVHAQPFSLSEGLAVAADCYLPGTGPHLVMASVTGLELDTASVIVNGNFHDEIRAGGTVTLPCSEPGSYEVVAAGGLFRKLYHVVTNGPRAGSGGLSYSIDPDILRRGAGPRRDDRVMICGSLVSPGEAIDALPYLPRGNGPAITISADGSSALCEKPEVSPWLQEVLGPGCVPRWEVPVEGAVWVLFPKIRKVRLCQDTAVAVVDEDLADILVSDLGLECRIEAASGIGRSVAEDRWLSLLVEAQGFLHVQGSGA